jgi:hypothetical protein
MMVGGDAWAARVDLAAAELTDEAWHLHMVLDHAPSANALFAVMVTRR